MNEFINEKGGNNYWLPQMAKERYRLDTTRTLPICVEIPNELMEDG